MGINRGPNNVKKDLYFGYDTGYGIADNATSTRFYPGEPTTNLYTNSDFSNGETGWTFSSWSSNSVTHTATTVAGPNGKVVSANKLHMGVNGGAVHFHQYNGGKYTSGNTYTTSAWVKGYGTFAIKSHWGGNTNFTMTGEWQRVSMTVTATSSSSSHFPYFAGEGLTVGSDFYITDAQAELKSHATPYVYSGSSTGSRSNTASLIDLKRSKTIDLTDVSFDSNAQIDFDGSDDYIGLNNQSSPITDMISVELVAKFDSLPASNSFMSIFQKQTDWNSAGGIMMQFIYNNFRWSYGNTWGGAVSYAQSNFGTNKYYHIVGTVDNVNGANAKLYINGVQVSSTGTGSKPNTTASLTIGKGNGGVVNGKIDVFKMYSNTLTADDVKQNYNAYKNRFNL